VKGPLLNIQDVSFGYDKDKDIIRGVTFQVNKGEVVGLLGPNGAGKTTLIKLLAGVHTPKKGQVTIFGQDPYSTPRVRKRFGVMHQSGGTDQMISGWDNLYIAGRFFGLERERVKKRVEELAVVFGEPTFLERPTLTYSGGQTRRLQILRALLHNPDFLVLDEPTTALDVEGRHAFYQALHDLLAERHITVIWTTHYLEEVERNCTRVLIIQDGTLLQDLPTAGLKVSVSSGQIEITLGVEDNELLESHPDLQSGFLQKENLIWEYQAGDEGEFYQQILPRLLAVGIMPKRIARREPRLEEVYLQLTRAKRDSRQQRVEPVA
jgi:ABC-2 type transport system ATP-binding protein